MGDSMEDEGEYSTEGEYPEKEEAVLVAGENNPCCCIIFPLPFPPALVLRFWMISPPGNKELLRR